LESYEVSDVLQLTPYTKLYTCFSLITKVVTDLAGSLGIEENILKVTS